MKATFWSAMRKKAEVAELVDALGSGSSWGFPVGVRVSPSAPRLHEGLQVIPPANPLYLYPSRSLFAESVNIPLTKPGHFNFTVSS